MIKKIFFLVVVLCLSNCGYNPIYLKKIDTDLLIKDYQLVGDKNINRSIISYLNIKNNSNRGAKYNLTLNSTKLVETVAKDKMGNASVYKTTIRVKLLISEGDILFKTRTFTSDFIYNNNSNKFDFYQYQKNIDKNLINNLSEKILIFLTS
tara:strand:+ start:1617 stop:2069 length:453 start_codon:yes stop_codon:yes gene_type:complete